MGPPGWYPQSISPLILYALLAALAQDPDAVRRLDYGKDAPLDIREAAVERRGEVAIHDISYASPKGGRVPAYLVVPKGKGPFAAILWGHWYWPNSPVRNRKEFLEEAVVLARAGVVSLLTDGPVARPGHVAARDPLDDRQAAERVQQIVDMRRGADLLLVRGDVDRRRLGYVGHSYNATVGAYLAGLDKRFRAFVLMAGTLSDEIDLKSAEYRRFREQVGAGKFDAFAAKYAWLDPGKFIPYAAPAEVFLQFATQEEFLTPERARQYAAIVSEPKRFQLYEAPHALNAEARRDRIAFLAEKLGFRRPSRAEIDGIPETAQPPAPDP